MSNPPIQPVRIERVSKPAEVPALTSIFHTAIVASGDQFHEILKRYAEDPYTELEKRLQAALSAPTDGCTEQHFVFKAIQTVPRYSPGDGMKQRWGHPGGGHELPPTKETIVGMAHWTVGYIDIPKVDPFEQQTAAAASASKPTDESTEGARLEEPIATNVGAPPVTSEPEASFDFYAVCRKPVRNTYISQIRGKKHVYLRRIAVDPDHQRRGIARQLLQWGIDRADSEKLVSYLNGRPHARSLYENVGFTAVGIVPMPVPGLEVADMVVMVRQPQPVQIRRLSQEPLANAHVRFVIRDR